MDARRTRQPMKRPLQQPPPTPGHVSLPHMQTVRSGPQARKTGLFSRTVNKSLKK